MLSWEKPLVKPMAPRVYFTLYKFLIYNSSLLFILPSLFSNLYNKNTKNIYFIISIRSHFCEWPWRDWQPLYRVGCKVLDCLCRYEAISVQSPTGLIPWLSKTTGNTYTTLLHHPFLFKGKTNACSRGSRKQSAPYAKYFHDWDTYFVYKPY